MEYLIVIIIYEVMRPQILKLWYSLIKKLQNEK